MTVVAALSLNAESTWIWSDSELYKDGRPSGHRTKVAINKSAHIVGTHAGTTFGLDALIDAVEFATSFDELMIGLPVLARGAAAEARSLPRFSADLPLWLFIAAGWSRRFRRIVGVSLEARNGFEPQYFSTGIARPYVNGFEMLHPHEPADVVGFAQQQMCEVQKKTPAAGAGTLTVAEVRRGAVSTTAFDIQSGAPLAALPVIPEMRAGYVSQVCDASDAVVEASSAPTAVLMTPSARILERS